MPRKASGRHEQQRERTRRYRQRLRSAGVPEADAVDMAVCGAVSAFVEQVRREAERAREAQRDRCKALRLQVYLNVLDEGRHAATLAALKTPVEAPAPAPLEPRDVAQRILRGAVGILIDGGYDPVEARRIVVRRLGRGGDPKQLDKLVSASRISIRPKASRGHGR